jgi:hypothetical protein
MTNEPAGPVFFFIFIVPVALFVSLIAAGLSKALVKERSRVEKTGIVVIAAAISLTFVAFVPSNTWTILGIMSGLIATLWFPLAVIIPSLCFPDMLRAKIIHTLVFLITFTVYVAEMGLFYLGHRAGLRDASVLFFPPVPLSYELMLWPVGFHAVLQFFITLVLASVVIVIVHRVPVLWQDVSPHQD